MRQRVTSEYSGDRYADLSEHVAGHKLVVAGQHLHGDAGGRHRQDRRPSTCFRRIEEDSEAGENEVAFVGYRCGVMIPIDHTSCYAQCTEPLRAEPVEGRLEGAAHCCVERPLLTVCFLVSSA